ncbi:phosphotransferase family protein [Haloarchaeobius amylolyticus]|uniref:phosphotransferase family protein n=1 Tax=Haloarchaeobius amylolyticus TaxID=1198296 RepID=UPI002270F790|nr:phosphotransferase [Haloarchaeobius amylolyticus]
MDTQLESVLAAAFPDRTVDEVGGTGPSWNERNRTVHVEFADAPPVFVKYATDGSPTRITRERAAMTYVGANTAVPVATVVASDIDHEVPYLATRPMAGENYLKAWMDGDEAAHEALVRDLGETLARIHSLRFHEHGLLCGGDETTLDLDVDPWSEVLVATIEDSRDLAPSDRFDHYFDEVIAKVRANAALLDDAPAALLHGDPAKPNCYCTESGLGMLDWEIAHVGDPARDLYRARAQQLDSFWVETPEDLVTALYDGYREQAGGLPDGYHEREPIYRAVWLLGTAGFYENMSEFADEPAEEFAEMVDAEMQRRLADI